ncbi:MAG TPA: hypothetical protein VK063_14045 [Beutenbergiaceae bacterium]|nr:hypothetical protein [Beutenbergiaceae bacterium]
MIETSTPATRTRAVTTAPRAGVRGWLRRRFRTGGLTLAAVLLTACSAQAGDLDPEVARAASDPGPDGLNEAAFDFATNVEPAELYDLVLGEQIDPELGGRIVAEGLGRYVAHSGREVDEGRDSYRALQGLMDLFHEEEHGRFYSMPDELRRAMAIALVSDPDNLVSAYRVRYLHALSNRTVPELLRDDVAARIMLEGAHGLQATQLAELIEHHLNADGTIELTDYQDTHLRRLELAGAVYQVLTIRAEFADVEEELRGPIHTGPSWLLLGLTPALGTDDGELVLDPVRLAEHLAMSDDATSLSIPRALSTRLLVLIYAAQQYPQMLEANLDPAQHAVVEQALEHEDPVQRQEALVHLWQVDLDGSPVKELVDLLVRQSYHAAAYA